MCVSFVACKKSGLKEQSKDEVQTWYFAEGKEAKTVKDFAYIVQSFGLPLSKECAQNVLAYCSSKDAKLGKTMEAIGYSNTRPIYDSEGNVDMDAGRRVSFKCLVNPDKA